MAELEKREGVVPRRVEDQEGNTLVVKAEMPGLDPDEGEAEARKVPIERS